VKVVHEPMKKWAEQHTSHCYEEQAGEERVKRGEDLCRARRELRDWSHPAQDHRRVEKRVDPPETSNEVIAAHSRSERNAQRKDGYQKVTDYTPSEFRTSKKPLMSAFVHLDFESTAKNL
jgi:hypothetical protein